jgi:hypothetical protein
MCVTERGVIFLLVALMAFGGLAAAMPASAAQPIAKTRHNYGCRINPRAAACNSTAKPVVANVGGSSAVTGLAGAVSNRQVTALPATGGGSPAVPNSSVLALLAASALILLGEMLRKLAKRPI